MGYAISAPARELNSDDASDIDTCYAIRAAQWFRERRQSEIIYNRNIDRSVFLIKHLVCNAKKDIRLLTGSFGVDVYGREEVYSSFIDAMGRGCVVKVLFDWTPGIRPSDIGIFSEKHQALNIIRRRHGAAEKFLCREVPEQVAKLYRYHFMVVDSTSYRFEEDRNMSDAIGQFGNAELSRNLAARFDEIWRHSKAF